MAQELPEGAWATGGGLIGAVLVWAAQRWVGKAAFQKVLNEGFSEFVEELRAENKLLREKAGAERRQLLGEIRQLQQQVRSLNTLLQKAGIQVSDKQPYDDVRFDHEIVEDGDG